MVLVVTLRTGSQSLPSIVLQFPLSAKRRFPLVRVGAVSKFDVWAVLHSPPIESDRKVLRQLIPKHKPLNT